MIAPIRSASGPRLTSSAPRPLARHCSRRKEHARRLDEDDRHREAHSQARDQAELRPCRFAAATRPRAAGGRGNRTPPLVLAPWRRRPSAVSFGGGAVSSAGLVERGVGDPALWAPAYAFHVRNRPVAVAHSVGLDGDLICCICTKTGLLSTLSFVLEANRPSSRRV